MATQTTKGNTRPGLRDLNEGQIELWLRTSTGLKLVAENVQEYDLDKVLARSELIDAVRAVLREVLTC